ncbi:ras and Rab interactor 2-like [Centropristis striata]|uniref:ras and Rab interactor 2-like n=1 Tax=Centropristis striata TaxID=184440 RepID=UPI0027E0ED19|nr:ras and Rab interactor 2-like [Centropristis striata]
MEEAAEFSFAKLENLSHRKYNRDVLPCTLKLTEAIPPAKTSANPRELAQLPAGFWDAPLCHVRKGCGSSSGKAAPDRPPPPAPRPVHLSTTPGGPQLQTRSPSELGCSQSNGALCFINPLFIKVHQADGVHSTTSDTSATARQGPREAAVLSDRLETTNKDTQQKDSPQVCSSDQSSEAKCLKTVHTSTSHCAATPGPPPRQRKMPEKIPWINEKLEGGTSLLYRLGSSLSISPSSSPPKRLSISSPISIPRPSLPISFPSLSYSPRRAKASPSSSQEDAQCHLALEDQTIEKALIRARLSQCNAARARAQDSSSPPDGSLTSKQADVTGGGEEEEEEEASKESRGGGGQRQSDMSFSTDSSDSLDFSQSSAFFLPPLHDPSPPTVEDFDTHLPLSLPPSHLPWREDDDDDEDDDEEEEPDFGASVESDQDQDLTMVPPGYRTKRRASASALVLQKALQGQLRKMSGVFNSLLTPEKRVIRRVVELSRDRSSYFGSLVQDYLSYMGEGAGTQAWQGYNSGLELLQTLRQFITQMKIYLRQSSELEPPIESLVPEEQIDAVLEKAMHKCILKPLKPVVNVALQEFQVRSGEWQELKENLSLAKARKPQEMGVADAVPPDPVAMDKIKHKFHTMSKMYSPEKKVTMLLRVCKLIYTIMEDNSGRLYGADDFLPMLTYVLAQCDAPQLDNEILYMMELLDPSLLHGEGGYYLTSAYGAMSLIKNFQEEQAARVLSSETRNTLHQWHRRRTTQRSAPSIDDFQNYLRVALQELDSGCTAKTLQVRPYASVEEVCWLCAQKFKVSDPENYGLFLVMEGSSQQLAPDTHPQKIKAELLSRSEATPFHFVFRRVANSNASSSSSSSACFDLTANIKDLSVASDSQANLNLLPEPPE